MYKIFFSKKATKFLLQNKNIIEKVEKTVNILKINPYFNNLDITKLKGYRNKYRIRIGKHRILYEIIEEKIIIIIFNIGQRGNIYKWL